MNTAAGAIIIFSVWIAGILIAVYLFAPSISSTISAIEIYTTQDTELKEQIGLHPDTSYTSLTPLGIFDFTK